MHAGIYKPTKYTRVTIDADSMNGQFGERIENTSGVQVRTRSDAFSGLEQYLAPTDDVYRVHEYTRTDGLRNGLRGKSLNQVGGYR